MAAESVPKTLPPADSTPRQLCLLQRYPISSALIAITLATVIFLLIQPYLSANEKLILGGSVAGVLCVGAIVCGVICYLRREKILTRWLELFGQKDYKSIPFVTRFEFADYKISKLSPFIMVRAPYSLENDGEEELLLIVVRGEARFWISCTTKTRTIEHNINGHGAISDDSLKKIIAGETVDGISLWDGQFAVMEDVPMEDGSGRVAPRLSHMAKSLRNFFQEIDRDVPHVDMNELNGMKTKLGTMRHSMVTATDDIGSTLLIRVKYDHKFYWVTYSTPLCLVDSNLPISNIFTKNEVGKLVGGIKVRDVVMG